MKNFFPSILSEIKFKNTQRSRVKIAQVSVHFSFFFDVHGAFLLKESLSISSPFWKFEQRGEIVVDNFVFTIFVGSDFGDASEFSDFLFLNETGAVSDDHFSFTISDSEDTLFVFSDDLDNEVLIFGVDTGWDGE